jgi:hypothetical protein
MFTEPVVVLPVTSVTTPPVTVAKLVLLDVQVATSVKGTGVPPPHGVPAAVRLSNELFPVNVNAAGLVGVTWIDWTHMVTVTVCSPVIVGFCVAAAVIVAVPVVTAVTNPLVEILATDASLVLQVTGVLPVLPSLKVANTDI